jgi:hypothetical protein
MFGSSITLDKAPLARVKRMSDLAATSVNGSSPALEKAGAARAGGNDEEIKKRLKGLGHLVGLGLGSWKLEVGSWELTAEASWELA